MGYAAGRFAVQALCAACLGACAVTPLPTLPAGDVPTAWHADYGNDTWPAANWWHVFSSDELLDLIERIEAHNFELANSQRNLRAAELALIDAGLDRFPLPSLDALISRSYSSRGSPEVDSSRVDMTLGVTYLDILGNRPRFAAAAARYESSVARAVDTRLRVYALAATYYFRILLLRDRMAAAQANLGRAKAIERIVRARVEVGTALASEGLRQRIVVRRQSNALRMLEMEVLNARASLARMVGESVWDFDIDSQTLGDVVVPTVVPGLPSELLLRRPDIVQAEAALREARADVDLARVAFLPRISMTGSALGSTLESLTRGGTATFRASSSLGMGVFDLGRRHRGLKVSRLRLESLLASYRRTVIGAFNDVEVALANIEALRFLGEVISDDVALAEESLRITEARYREGVREYETLLAAQASLYDTRNAWLNNKLSTLLALVDLYVALGGGWRRED